MTANKKNPTNSDIIRKLDAMDTRINALESWKIAEDAAKTAVAQYRQDERQTTQGRQIGGLIKDLLPLIVALTVLAYALAGHYGH